MKARGILYCGLLLMAASCSRHRMPQVLVTADSLCNVLPDSAIALLAAQEPLMENQPRAVRMYHKLLTIKAADKGDVRPVSDSAINEVLQYYGKHDDGHRAEAFYYGGRVNYVLDQGKPALDYFQKAADLLKGSKDYDLLSRIYSQMSNLLLYQEVFDEAMKSMRKAYRYDVLLNDTDGMVHNLVDMSDIQKGLQNLDSARYYGEAALHLAKAYGDRNVENRVHRTLADIHYMTGSHEQALAELDSIRFPAPYLTIPLRAIRADAYYLLGNADSAAYYYNKLLELDNVYANRTAYLGLLRISRDRKDLGALIDYLDKYMEASQAYRERTNTETIQKAQSAYDYDQKEKEAMRYKERHENLSRWVLFLIIISISLAFAASVIFYRMRARRLKSELEREQAVRSLNELYMEREAYKEEKNAEIQQLKDEIKTMSQDKVKMHEKLESQEKKIDMLVKEQKTYDKKKSSEENILQNSEIYKQFHAAAQRRDKSGQIKDYESWEGLRNLVDSCFDNFTSRLSSTVSLSEVEMRTCLLIKIGIRPAGIAAIFGYKNSAVSHIRKVLYMKFFNENKDPKYWDDYVLNL